MIQIPINRVARSDATLIRIHFQSVCRSSEIVANITHFNVLWRYVDDMLNFIRVLYKNIYTQYDYLKKKEVLRRTGMLQMTLNFSAIEQLTEKSG